MVINIGIKHPPKKKFRRISFYHAYLLLVLGYIWAEFDTLCYSTRSKVITLGWVGFVPFLLNLNRSKHRFFYRVTRTCEKPLIALVLK